MGPTHADDHEAFLAVLTEVHGILARLKPDKRPQITPTTSVIFDLDMDSLGLVDLSAALEAAFDLDEFPIQEWCDEEEAIAGSYSVDSLARECLRRIRVAKEHR